MIPNGVLAVYHKKTIKTTRSVEYLHLVSPSTMNWNCVHLGSTMFPQGVVVVVVVVFEGE